MPHQCHCSWVTFPHKTFGQCMRSKNIKVAYCQSAKGLDYSTQKRWDRDLDGYASARSEGMQPKSTNANDVQMAREWSDKEGVAYGIAG